MMLLLIPMLPIILIAGCVLLVAVSIIAILIWIVSVCVTTKKVADQLDETTETCKQFNKEYRKESKYNYKL